MQSTTTRSSLAGARTEGRSNPQHRSDQRLQRWRGRLLCPGQQLTAWLTGITQLCMGGAAQDSHLPDRWAEQPGHPAASLQALVCTDGGDGQTTRSLRSSACVCLYMTAAVPTSADAQPIRDWRHAWKPGWPLRRCMLPSSSIFSESIATPRCGTKAQAAASDTLWAARGHKARS
jgi:hypothetical protein